MILHTTYSIKHNELRDSVIECLVAQYPDIHMDGNTSLRSIVEDSLELYDLIFMLEDRFDVNLSSPDDLVTIDDLVKLISKSTIGVV